MPINSTHPLYKSNIGRWTKCRDAFEGSDAIKAKGVEYLPRLSGMTDAEYDAYKTRALFYGMTAKTVSALTGMATAREPQLKFSDDMSIYFQDGRGLQFLETFGQTLSELILMGRIAHLVDAPMDGGDPYISLYSAESIINWSTDENDNIIWAVLAESTIVQNENDKFKKEDKGEKS